MKDKIKVYCEHYFTCNSENELSTNDEIINGSCPQCGGSWITQKEFDSAYQKDKTYIKSQVKEFFNKYDIYDVSYLYELVLNAIKNWAVNANGGETCTDRVKRITGIVLNAQLCYDEKKD